MKQCTKCKKEKEVIEFNKSKNTKDGLNYICKSCKEESNKIYREKYPEKHLNSVKRWRKNNPGYVTEYHKNWKKENPDYNKQHYKNQPGGVYRIINLINNKVYIGQSKSLPYRKSTHKSKLKNNTHINTELQLDYNKYGWDNFHFEILHYSDIKEDRLELEELLINYIKPYYNQYKTQ